MAGSLFFLSPPLMRLVKLLILNAFLLEIFGNVSNRDWAGEMFFSKILHRCYSSIGTLG